MPSWPNQWSSAHWLKFGKLIPDNTLEFITSYRLFSWNTTKKTGLVRLGLKTVMVKLYLCDCWIGCDLDKQCRNHCICFWTGSAGSIEEDAAWKRPRGCVRSRMYLMLEKQERVTGDDFPLNGSEWVCLGICIIVCLIIEEDAVGASSLPPKSAFQKPTKRETAPCGLVAIWYEFSWHSVQPSRTWKRKKKGYCFSFLF